MSRPESTKQPREAVRGRRHRKFSKACGHWPALPGVLPAGRTQVVDTERGPASEPLPHLFPCQVPTRHVPMTLVADALRPDTRWCCPYAVVTAGGPVPATQRRGGRANPQIEATTEVASRAWLREACLHLASLCLTGRARGSISQTPVPIDWHLCHSRRRHSQHLPPWALVSA